MSPTQLTLRHLRNQGYTAEVVERRIPFNNVTQDLFGFIDVLAIRGDETLAVQTTSVSNVPSRVNKIADAPLIGAVREAGWRIVVQGWKKVGNRWQLAREVDVS